MSVSLTTTRSTLMHAALVHISPQLIAFDVLAFGKLRHRALSQPRSLSYLPVEILLQIRSCLLPVLIAHFIAASATSLQNYEASLRRLVCFQCTLYNEYVYGLDVWNWHLSGPCSCVDATPDTPSVRRLNPKTFCNRHHWLEAHLSSKALRFRGLSTKSSPSSTIIWDVAADVLREFGCEAIRRGLGRRGSGMALLSRWDGQSVIVVPLPSSLASTRQTGSSKDHGTWAARSLLRRVDRDLGLGWDYNEPCRRSTTMLSQSLRTTFDFASTTQLPFAGDTTVVVFRILETITTPLTVIISLPISCITLFFTVLCYYYRPGALRLF